MAKINFWAVCEAHAQAIRDIYNMMMRRGHDVSFSISKVKVEGGKVHVSLKPPKTGNIVTSSGQQAWAYIKSHGRIIYLQHGLSKHELYAEYPLVKQFKGVMFPGAWWKKKMQTLYGGLPAHHSVVGWPKTDILFRQSDSDSDKLRQQLGVPKGKLILYASSYTGYNEKRTHRRILYAKALATAGRRLGFNVLLKAHPAMTDRNFKLLRREVSGEKNVYVVPLHSVKNMVTLYPLVDALTSEHSSTLYEFLATGKPSVQLTPWVNAKKAVGGVTSANINKLDKVFSSLKPHPEALEWQRRLLGTVDGKATEQAVKFIEETFHG